MDSTSSYPDYDGDGYDSSIDCNDYDASVYPGAPEIANDGIDQDCDGVDLTSGGNCYNNEMLDCNGNCVPISWSGDGFCDSGINSWHGNIVDYDCALLNYEDGDCSSSGMDYDGDGFDSTVDCNDYDASIYPGALEIPNDGIDQDCDGVDQTTSTGGCSSSEIADCNGNCAPSNWLGDGICDQGSYTYMGNAIYFNCANLSFDLGDCSSSGTDYDGDGFDSTVDCNDYDASITQGFGDSE